MSKLVMLDATQLQAWDEALGHIQRDLEHGTGWSKVEIADRIKAVRGEMFAKHPEGRHVEDLGDGGDVDA